MYNNTKVPITFFWMLHVKVLLHNIDFTAMCSLTKRHLNFNEDEYSNLKNINFFKRLQQCAKFPNTNFERNTNYFSFQRKLGPYLWCDYLLIG